MNWSEIERDWNGKTALLRSYWDRLTDDDIKAVDRKRERLIQTLQVRYEIPIEEANDAVCKFEQEIRWPEQ